MTNPQLADKILKLLLDSSSPLSEMQIAKELKAKPREVHATIREMIKLNPEWFQATGLITPSVQAPLRNMPSRLFLICLIAVSILLLILFIQKI